MYFPRVHCLLVIDTNIQGLKNKNRFPTSQLAKSMEIAREVLEKRGGEANSKSDATTRCRALDLVPRNSEFTNEIKEVCSEIGEVLQKLHDNGGDIFQVTPLSYPRSHS